MFMALSAGARPARIPSTASRESTPRAVQNPIWKDTGPISGLAEMIFPTNGHQYSQHSGDHGQSDALGDDL